MAKLVFNPDYNKVEAIFKGLLKMKDKYGEYYCPCKLDKVEENICPCEEMYVTGACHCDLFKIKK